ncbi:MAG: two-component system, NarL family, sensor histidine kinase DesK [Nocardioidaceae bacterium]|jgi:two-component system sensor histidine kinase DesK|nr:two-component system, NarL family, sensor histidine kinase DesK [Nocardioidaceae bacterium]
MTSLASVATHDTDPQDRARFGRLLGAGVWLFFLGNPVGVLLKNDDLLERYTGLAALAVFVPVYLYGLAHIPEFHLHRRRLHAWSYITVLLACFAVIVPGAGDQSTTCLVFITALSVAILPKIEAWAVVVVMFAAITIASYTVDGWSAHGNNLAVVLAAAAVWSFRLAWQRQAKLMAAEQDLSELAVQEERARIARDLHDILGHSLTVISVKAELAERLFDDDPERARAELTDLQRLSRDALADVRSTAQGIRGISLPGEIASARMALESAGIEPLLPTVADEVPSRWRELFAWTLREGVTNVIRHSEASTCEVELDAERIRVTDDGRGVARGDDDGSGNGLEGLRQRARLAGAIVTTSSGPGDRGFSLTVSVPA